MSSLSIIITVLIPICSGLAFLAYKHPKGYDKIAPVIFIIVTILFFGYTNWMLGYKKGFNSANDFDYSSEGIPMDFGTTFIIYGVALAYIFFLSYLQNIIDDDKQKLEDEKDNSTNKVK